MQVGETHLKSKATMLAYLLGLELEGFTGGVEATDLSSAAWDLLRAIGKYERADKEDE